MPEPSPSPIAAPPMGAPPLPPRPQIPGNTAPAAMPTNNLGQRARGIAGVSAICKVLEQVIPMLGSETEEGQAALDALKKLSKYAGASSDVTSQEMKLMAAKAPAVPPPSPVAGAQQRIASLALPAAGGAAQAA